MLGPFLVCISRSLIEEKFVHPRFGVSRVTPSRAKIIAAEPVHNIDNALRGS